MLSDAFTWVGIAPLAFQFVMKNAATILAKSLALRVTAFILFGPYAAVFSDRIDRKKIIHILSAKREYPTTLAHANPGLYFGDFISMTLNLDYTIALVLTQAFFLIIL